VTKAGARAGIITVTGIATGITTVTPAAPA